MSKKRRSEVSLDSKTPAKKEKAPEFNGTVFKSMLKDPTTAMKGLEMFVSTSKKLPCSDLYDVVEGYIKISMECAEIFTLLEGQKPIDTELLLIFESLEVILLRTASDLSHFKMVGIAIVKKTVSNHMKLLQSSLHSENHRFVRQCLGLLSALVSQGAESARDVLSHIHINKTLSALAKRRDRKGRPDVRLAFIQFVLSFLVVGDNSIIGQILESKELLPEILSTGLKEDRMSTVNLILSTLKTRVVMNKSISKTQKVRFFTPVVLANVASLYKWDGIVDASTDDDQTVKHQQLPGTSIVRDLVHRFLLEICCSRKNGISFHDASFGTAGRPGNLVLLQFLVGLKQASEDELVAELVVNVLKASPDILSRYLKETQHSYTPRLKSAWQDNIKLLKRIYEAQPDVSSVFQSGEVIPPPRLLSMILVISLPPVCNRAFFSHALSLANTAAQVTTLSMMNFILKRAHRNVQYLEDKAFWCSSDGYTSQTMEELVQQYKETLSKILPDMTSIVEKWQSLGKKEKACGEEIKPQTEDGAELTDANVPSADSSQVILTKALILQVICMYQKVVPHLVSQCKFDFSKLLKGIVSEKGVKEEVPPVLQHQILQLALDLPASKFFWFRIQDVADKDSSSGEKSVLYLLLKMFVSSRSSHLKTSTKMLVVKVLKDTGVFEHTWRELELWLNQLTRLHANQQDTVIHFLERVLVKLVCSSHTYTDKVASLVQDAGYLQANLNQDADTSSIPVSHIDDVLDMIDVIMEGNDGEMEEFGPSLSEDLIIQTFPFSPLVPAALETRNKLAADSGAVLEYLCAVLSDVLHCQRDPLPLCLAFLHYDKEFEASNVSAPPHSSVLQLYRYYSKWLPQKGTENLFQSSESQSDEHQTLVTFTTVMQAAYTRGPEALLQDSFRKRLEEVTAVTSAADFPVAIKQILLYIKSAAENFGTFSKDIRDGLLRNLLEILKDLVTRLQGLRENTNCEPAAETETSQEESELFLDVNQASAGEADGEQILVAVLDSIFKHPSLEQWFLALERSAIPPHSLNPVRLRTLSSLMSDGVLLLLQLSAPTLCAVHHLELLHRYTTAVKTAVLKELKEKRSQPPRTHSRSFLALLSLHSFMDPRDVRELVSELLLLPHTSLVSPSSEGTQAELSVYGRAALQILTEFKSTSVQDGDVFPSRAHLRGLGTLLLSCSNPTLEAFLLQTLFAEPSNAKLVHTDVLLHCLQRPVVDCVSISSLLLQHGSTHCLCFETWCLEPSNIEKLSEEMDLFLTVIMTYLRVASSVDTARPLDVQKEVLRNFKRGMLLKLSQRVLGSLAEESGAQLAEALSHLIKLSAEPADIRDLISDLPIALQKVDSYERWRVVDVITEKLADRPEEREKWRKSVATAALKCLVSSFTHCKDLESSPSEHEQSILTRLQQLMVSAEDISASDWNSLVKNGLKYRYRDPHFLNTLRLLLDVMYSGSEDHQKDLIPLSTLHMMSSSHSLFLPTMLDTSCCQAKEELLSLLLSLVKRCSSVCNINHFVVLLGAYGASMSSSDQKLLLLLQEYEQNQVSLLKFQSFLWGPAAVEHHKTRKSLGASLWKQTSSDEVLALLKTDRMLQTVAHFPQQRRILPQDSPELLHHNEALTDLGNIYDPCFLLPLFSAILQPECIIDCSKFVSSHALGVTLMALSSYDPKTRAAAYHVLSCFYHHLEGARFREKRQLLYLMDMVKNGVWQQNQRLPFVLTTYIAKVAQLMLKPEDHMYVLVNRFLLTHQSLDFRRVPEFFRLFYGFEMEHKVEREWILSVLEDGINDNRCYQLCNQQGIFQVLLSFSSTPLCDEHAQIQVIRVLCRAAHVTKAAYDLIKSAGLLTWMVQMVEKRNLEQRLLCALIELFHVLWFTNLGQKEKQADETKPSTSTDEKPQTLKKCLPLPIIAEFLCVASTISVHLRLAVKAPALSLFLQTLCSVLKHRGTALGVKAQAEQLTLHPQPLSSTEALALLLCWASLSRETSLVTQIRALCRKHKVTELMRMGKNQVQSSVFKTKAQKENLAEETEAQKREENLLTQCKLDLCSIFVHWEPVSDQLGPSVLLSTETAQLLTKWSLRCLVQDEYDPIRAQEFLHWFEKAVIKHRETMEAVVLDAGLKADLLRLYHRAFQTQHDNSNATGKETLQLFTNIMTCLLEIRGDLPELHHPVVSTCMAEHTEDQSKQDAGLSLMSLYIHEVWSGATTPELFLSHMHLVQRSEQKECEASQTSPAAIRALCSDIITNRQETSL
ncbi:nucleolar pre-ribosomal-associated protein 1 [Gouania willdenowi]|uniref:nucleolar pre-ribosomal-associated protein 1 n=1 Tax=Gouania willdenowi TaxID=441366 RepID=UPI0010547CDB|nr:nucleolar pre-ribosomal-associated protein 1 [Gouania willdenowi]